METSSSEEFCELFADSSKGFKTLASVITEWSVITKGTIQKKISEDGEIIYHVSYDLEAVRKHIKKQTPVLPKQLTSYERDFKRMLPYFGKVIQTSHGGKWYKIWEFRKSKNAIISRKRGRPEESKKAVNPDAEPAKLSKFTFDDEYPWQLTFEIVMPIDDRILDIDWHQ